MKNTIRPRSRTSTQKKLNKVTEKALKMSERGKGLKKFNSLKELLEDLRI